MKPVGYELRSRAGQDPLEAVSLDLDATFSALADPTRRAILTRLAQGEASVSELAAPFSMSQPGISKHLKVLERAGLIARRREAQRRPCRLVSQPLAAADEWLGDFRQFWDGSFDQLDVLLGAMKVAASPATSAGAAREHDDSEPAAPEGDQP